MPYCQKVYDLILNKQTLDDERSKLIEFKNAVEIGKEFAYLLKFIIKYAK